MSATLKPHRVHLPAWADRLGAFGAFLCALHCALVPIALALVPALVAATLRRPVHIALSYDEEVGCLGVRSLLKVLEERPVKPMLCIIGEPTELKPVLGHKGKLAMRCDVQGHPCHSAYAPYGVNAIEHAARLIGHLGDTGQRLIHVLGNMRLLLRRRRNLDIHITDPRYRQINCI